MLRGARLASPILVLATAVVVMLAALPFIPESGWASFLLAVCVLTALMGLGAFFLAGRRRGALSQALNALNDAFRFGNQTIPSAQLAAIPDELLALVSGWKQSQSELRRALGERERDRARLAALLQCMADGLLVVDNEEEVTLSNPAAARLLGQNSLEGRRLVEAARDPDLVALARSARATSPVVQVIELHRAATSFRRWVQVVATRLPDNSGTLVLLQDVTELRRVEVIRRDVVANISHELRTPIASLKALVETLENGALEDPEASSNFLRLIHVEIDGLAHLVSELLELHRVETGRLDLNTRPVPVIDLLTHAVERMAPYAERLGLSVTLIESPSLELAVMADPQRIGQVLANLLANAVKFTPHGGRITVGAARVDEGVELWVHDTGVGIRPENLTRVFERFYKTDPSRAGGGTGLGLAIAKHLVLAHGGTIQAESAGERQGATFRFTLPLAPPVSEREEPANPRSVRLKA